MGRTLRPATPAAHAHLKTTLTALRTARASAAKAECPQTLKKIRSALKSAEGAERHMTRRLGSGA